MEEAARFAASPESAEKCGTPHTHAISAPTPIATPTHKPTRCPMPKSANDRKKSKPETARSPTRKLRATSLAKMRVAVMSANAPEITDPQTSAASAARVSSTPRPCAPQRDRIQDAEDAAKDTDRARDPVRKPGPPADHDHAGQYEDDRGERARGRSHGLHDVVLLDGCAANRAQCGHGDHRRRNGGGKGETCL